MKISDIYTKNEISEFIRIGLLTSQDIKDHWSNRDEIELYMKYNYANIYASARYNTDTSWNRRYEKIARMSPREVIELAKSRRLLYEGEVF